MRYAEQEPNTVAVLSDKLRVDYYVSPSVDLRTAPNRQTQKNSRPRTKGGEIVARWVVAVLSGVLYLSAVYLTGVKQR